MKELHQLPEAVCDKVPVVDGDGWCFVFSVCFAFVGFLILQIMYGRLRQRSAWVCLFLLFWNFGLLELLCWFSVLANYAGSILLWTGFGRT
jgi:hypothetical protein